MRIPSSRAEQSAGPSLDDCGLPATPSCIIPCNSELHSLGLPSGGSRSSKRQGGRRQTEFLFSTVTPLGALPLGDVVWQEKREGRTSKPSQGPARQWADKAVLAGGRASWTRLKPQPREVHHGGW